MATFLQSGFLASLLVTTIVFIFVFAIVYALLKKTKFFGESSGVNTIIAFAIAFLTLFFPASQVLISSFVPWLFLLFVLVLFIFLFLMFLGVKDETLADAAKSGTFTTFAVLAIIILFLVAMGKAFGPFLLVTGEPGFWPATKRAIFNARFLGLIFLLMLAAYAIQFISSTEK